MSLFFRSFSYRIFFFINRGKITIIFKAGFGNRIGQIFWEFFWLFDVLIFPIFSVFSIRLCPRFVRPSVIANTFRVVDRLRWFMAQSIAYDPRTWTTKGIFWDRFWARLEGFEVQNPLFLGRTFGSHILKVYKGSSTYDVTVLGGGGSAICDVLLNFWEVSEEKNVTSKKNVKKSIFTVTSYVDDP